jgi:carbamoylphosphate synthase small subunit
MKKESNIKLVLKNGMEFSGYSFGFDKSVAGDPEMCVSTINTLKNVLFDDRPVFGICLGSQLMALASGASTYKLKYGHRSHNQPVRKVGENKCFITSQNHGFAIDNDTLGREWEPFFINVNDGM